MIATIPAALIGLAFEKTIEEKSLSPFTMALSLMVGRFLLWWIEMQQIKAVHDDSSENLLQPDFDAITPVRALATCLTQTVALIPGISRSDASIVGGMLTALNRVTATAFSFYLGMPLIGRSSLYKLYKVRHDLSSVQGGFLWVRWSRSWSRSWQFMICSLVCW